MRTLRRPRHATVVAYVALVASLGGTAVAAGVIDGGAIRKRSIPGSALRDHTITKRQLDASRLGTVPAAARAQALDGFTRSGLIRASKGQTKRVTTIGTLQVDLVCAAAAGGHAIAHLTVKNTAASTAWVSSYTGSYTDVALAAGATAEVGYDSTSTTDDSTYFFSDGYQVFDVVSAEGRFAHGDGMLGVNIDGSDCVSAVWTIR